MAVGHDEKAAGCCRKLSVLLLFFIITQRSTPQTHTTGTHHRHTPQIHTTDTHHRGPHHRHTPQRHTTDTHHRHSIVKCLPVLTSGRGDIPQSDEGLVRVLAEMNDNMVQIW